MIVQSIMRAHKKEMSANTLRRVIRIDLLEDMSFEGNVIKCSMTEKIGVVATQNSISSKQNSLEKANKGKRTKFDNCRYALKMDRT